MKINKLEFRSYELRAIKNEDNSKMIIEGTVNNIGEWSKVMYGQFREKVEKGVFTRALANAKDSGRDVFFLALHNNRNLPMASINSATMELKEEDGKLKIRAELPETTLAKDIHALVKAGVLRDFSFGFNQAKCTWDKDADGIRTRTITDMNLFEVSIVSTGAYSNTEIQARSLDWEDIKPKDNEEREEEKNLNSEELDKEVLKKKEEEASAEKEKLEMEKRNQRLRLVELRSKY